MGVVRAGTGLDSLCMELGPQCLIMRLGLVDEVGWGRTIYGGFICDIDVAVQRTCKSNLGIFNATKHKKVPINYFKGAKNCCKEPQPPMPTKIMEKPWKC